jgi:hypothetical protein
VSYIQFCVFHRILVMSSSRVSGLYTGSSSLTRVGSNNAILRGFFKSGPEQPYKIVSGTLKTVCMCGHRGGTSITGIGTALFVCHQLPRKSTNSLKLVRQQPCSHCKRRVCKGLGFMERLGLCSTPQRAMELLRLHHRCNHS